MVGYEEQKGGWWERSGIMGGEILLVELWVLAYEEQTGWVGWVV